MKSMLVRFSNLKQNSLAHEITTFALRRTPVHPMSPARLTSAFTIPSYTFLSCARALYNKRLGLSRSVKQRTRESCSRLL